MSIRVAIVEDNDPLRGTLAMLIGSSRGFELIGCYSDAESALEGLPRSKPDIVLLNIQLRKHSGTECVRRIKPDLPKAQIMILSIYEDEERVFEALRAGAVGYVSKDTSPAEILEAIQDAHCGGSLMSSGIARMVAAHFQMQMKAAPAGPLSAPRLSRREEEILELLVKGYRYKEVADHFACSLNTVREHLRGIYEKLHATASTAADRPAPPRPRERS